MGDSCSSSIFASERSNVALSGNSMRFTATRRLPLTEGEFGRFQCVSTGEFRVSLRLERPDDPGDRALDVLIGQVCLPSLRVNRLPAQIVATDPESIVLAV